MDTDAKPNPNICTLICLVLVLGTALLYWPITTHPFIIYDDEQYVVDNHHVTSGLSSTNTVWAFTSGEAANWHPLTWITHQADCSLYGLNAGGHHFTNLLFHVVNTLLLFFFLRSATGTLWRSAFVAALFGWHPLHVESVAWAAERKDVLSTFFWLLTLMAYVRYTRTVHRAAKGVFYGLALVLFACGLMSKPMVVTLPCVLLLLDLWPLYRFRFCPPPKSLSEGQGSVAQPAGIGWLIVEKIPFAVMAALGSYVTFLVQTDAGAVWATPWSERIANALIAYARYVLKVFSPTDLAIVYSHPKHWPFSLTISAAILLLLWTAPILIFWRRYPVYFVGWFWFLGTLVPTIGIIQVGAQSMADRYMYIPSIGFFIVVVWAWIELTNRYPQWKNLSAILAGTALAACLLATSIQITYWRNSKELFLHAIEVSPNNYIAANCLGKAFEREGDLKRALVLYKNSVELEPRFPQSQFNYAMCAIQFGLTNEFVQHLKAASDLEPNDSDIQFDLGVYFAEHGSLTNSLNCYSNVVLLRPDFAAGHFNYACTLADLGQFPAAAAHFREALKLQPNFPHAQAKLDRILKEHPEAVHPATSK